MAPEDDMTGKIRALGCEVSPSKVDAGADLSVKATISCIPAEDLRGTTLLIRDQDGALVESVELTEFDGEANKTVEFIVKAPVRPGAYRWLAVSTARAEAGIGHDEDTSAPFSFTVNPHGTHVIVWDVPSAIERGENFSVKFGVKCSSGCAPNDWALKVRDHNGKNLVRATVCNEVWPGTAALYYTEVELTAPETAGLYAWEVLAREGGADVSHAEGTASFSVRVVHAPECVLTVEAVDREGQTPVQGAKVVVHPYRTFTDQSGVAEVRIPKGAYRIFVSGKNYLPFRSDGDIKTDTTIRAELAVDRELSDADIWS